jgi:hypothetical protein
MVFIQEMLEDELTSDYELEIDNSGRKKTPEPLAEKAVEESKQTAVRGGSAVKMRPDKHRTEPVVRIAAKISRERDDATLVSSNDHSRRQRNIEEESPRAHRSVGVGTLRNRAGSSNRHRNDQLTELQSPRKGDSANKDDLQSQTTQLEKQRPKILVDDLPHEPQHEQRPRHRPLVNSHSSITRQKEFSVEDYQSHPKRHHRHHRHHRVFLFEDDERHHRHRLHPEERHIIYYYPDRSSGIECDSFRSSHQPWRGLDHPCRNPPETSDRQSRCPEQHVTGILRHPLSAQRRGSSVNRKNPTRFDPRVINKSSSKEKRVLFASQNDDQDSSDSLSSGELVLPARARRRSGQKVYEPEQRRRSWYQDDCDSDSSGSIFLELPVPMRKRPRIPKR